MKKNKNIFIHEVIIYNKIYEIFCKNGGKSSFIEVIFFSFMLFLLLVCNFLCINNSAFFVVFLFLFIFLIFAKKLFYKDLYKSWKETIGCVPYNVDIYSTFTLNCIKENITSSMLDSVLKLLECDIEKTDLFNFSTTFIIPFFITISSSIIFNTLSLTKLNNNSFLVIFSLIMMFSFIIYYISINKKLNNLLFKKCIVYAKTYLDTTG